MSARYYELIGASSMWVEHRSDECPYCDADDGWYSDDTGCIRPVRTIPGPDISLPAWAVETRNGQDTPQAGRDSTSGGVAWQER